MAMKTKKHEDIWPDLYDNEDDDSYLNLLAPETYQAIDKALAERSETIRKVLNPKPGFDILLELRRAVCIYYFHAETKNGKHTPLLTASFDKKKKLLAAAVDQTRSYLKYFDENLMVMAGLIDRNGLLTLMDSLSEIILQAEAQQEFLFPDKTGRPRGVAMTAFMSKLLLIYEEGTGEKMTARTSQDKGGPYGPALEFIKSCLPLIGHSLGDHSIHAKIKKTTKRRELIKKSSSLR
jgi:hypothetical protein